MKVIPDTVAIGYVHPNTVFEGFARSLAEACLTKENHIIRIISAASARHEHARNTVVSSFLDGVSMGQHGGRVGAEWFMWIDTDMTFDRDAIARLLATAKQGDADMVQGLGFVYRRKSNEVVPNGWRWDEDDQDWTYITEYTPGRVYEIDGAGSGFILIHRRVFEFNDNNEWHKSGIHPNTGNYMGHDLAFCYDHVVSGPFKLLWDTRVKTGHIKHFALTEKDYQAYKESKK